MTVCTQNFEVPSIGSPVFDAPAPRPCSAIGAHLCFRPNVVQFEDANVIDTARNASSAKIRDQFALDRPIAFLSPPIGREASAINATVTVSARRPAVQARSVAPSALRVAPARTVLRSFETKSGRLNIEQPTACYASAVVSRWFAIGRQAAKPLVPSGRLRLVSTLLRAELSRRAARERLTAFLAIVVDWFHGVILTSRNETATYFDIACERVHKAYSQPDFFVAPQQPKIEQTELFGGGGA